MMKMYTEKSRLSIKVKRLQNKQSSPPREIPVMAGFFAIGIDCSKHGSPGKTDGKRSSEALRLIEAIAGESEEDKLFIDIHSSVCCGLIEEAGMASCCLETNSGNHYKAVMDGIEKFLDAAELHQKRLDGHKITLFFSYSGDGVYVDRMAKHTLKGVDLLAIPSETNYSSQSVDGISYISIAQLQGIFGGHGVDQAIYFLDCCRTKISKMPGLTSPAKMHPEAMALFPVGIGVKLWEDMRGESLLSQSLASVLNELRSTAGNKELSVKELRRRLEYYCRSSIGVRGVAAHDPASNRLFEASFEDDQNLQDGKIIWKFRRTERLDVEINVLIDEIDSIRFVTVDNASGDDYFRISLPSDKRTFELPDVPKIDFLILCYSKGGERIGNPIFYNFDGSADNVETTL